MGDEAREIVIRVYLRGEKGEWQDLGESYDLGEFAGQVPAVGDAILKPGVPVPLDRDDPANRILWRVVDRVFNPRDLRDYVLLVVKEEPVSAGQGIV